MKRVLFVDYTYQIGHVNFNQIHIEALKAEGYDVKIILHKRIVEQLPFNKDDYALVLPDFLRQRDGHAVINRILFILALLFIKVKVRVKKFDKVIISYCDEVTIGILPLCHDMYIICHNNADSFCNSVKRFFIKHLAQNNFFIVFNKGMTKPFEHYGIKNVFVVSHGCVSPFKARADVSLPIDTSSYDWVVFHPSPNLNTDFIIDLLSNVRFEKYLRDNNILFLLRDKSNNAKGRGNIKFINGYLSQLQYQQLFLLSDLILLAYPETFEYRVSGVSFECVANGKRLLIKRNIAFDYCRDFFNYDPMFDNVTDLCGKIDFLKHNKDAKCIASTEGLLPDYTCIFSC